MEQERLSRSIEELNSGIREIKKFRDLLSFIHNEKLSEEYGIAYDETVEIAKKFVETKTKSTWDRGRFEETMKSKYPHLSSAFLEALGRCVEYYNPPVNLPDEPAW